MMMCLIISMAKRWYVTLCIVCHIGCKYAGILTGANKRKDFNTTRLCIKKKISIYAIA